MEQAEVQQAVAQLQQQGAAVTAAAVHRLLGRGSLRDVYKHLRALEVQPVTEAGADPDPTMDPPPDPLAEAEQALTHAQAQVLEAEAQLPAREHALEDATSQLLTAVSRDEAGHAAVRRGLLAPDAPALAQGRATVTAAHQAMQEAAWQLDQARQRLLTWQQRAQEAGQRRTQALRQAWVRTHHPALWQALQEAREARAADPLLQDPRIPCNALQASVRKFDSAVVRAVSYHQQRIEALEADIAQLLASAEV